MGYRCRWIAVRAGQRADVVSRLGFAITQELNEEVHDTGLHAVAVPGWFVVIGDGWDFMDLVERGQAERLSARDEVIYFYTDDSPMYAEVTCYRDGQTAWSVSYDGSDGIATPIVDGDIPERARSIFEAARAKQATAEPDVDYIYDGVAEMAREVVGFRHDQTLASGEHLPIYQLEPGDPARSAPPPLDVAVAAAKRVLGSRTIEAIVNAEGVVELYLVVHSVATPHGANEVALDQIRAQGVEADDGDELLFPFYYLPDDEDMASDQRRSGLATLLQIPSDAFEAMQRELAGRHPPS